MTATGRYDESSGEIVVDALSNQPPEKTPNAVASTAKRQSEGR
jgi:hypothetical protein